MNKNASDADYEMFKQLVDLWGKENPIKTNKLQVLLVVNSLLLTAVNISGGFRQQNWPLYLGGAIFSLVWILSIGRTSLFQDIWQIKIERLSAKYPDDQRFQILKYDQEDLKSVPAFLRFAGFVPSKYYLIGAPFIFCIIWTVLLLLFVAL